LKPFILIPLKKCVQELWLITKYISLLELYENSSLNFQGAFFSPFVPKNQHKMLNPKNKSNPPIKPIFQTTSFLSSKPNLEDSSYKVASICFLGRLKVLWQSNACYCMCVCVCVYKEKYTSCSNIQSHTWRMKVNNIMPIARLLSTTLFCLLKSFQTSKALKNECVWCEVPSFDIGFLIGLFLACSSERARIHSS
jgi:hypothetical protein